MAERKFFYAGFAATQLLTLLATAALVAVTQALTPQHCYAKLVLKVPADDESCPAQGHCGALDPRGEPFLARLSPQCHALFDTYRSEASRAGLTNLITPPAEGPAEGPAQRPCQLGAATRPRNPVVFSASSGASSAVICSTPKSGCTAFRKLLWNVLRHHRPGATRAPHDMTQQVTQIHFPFYPTLWLFGNRTSEGPEPRVPESIPSMMIVRNPYTRLLSGFRDKMVRNPERVDQHTFQDVNRHLGVPPKSIWKDTPRAFRAFVHRLSRKGVAGVDAHFAPAADLCGHAAELRYDFHLPLEDIARWFPCWMHGLDMREWAERGWAESPFGVIYVGNASDAAFVTVNAYGWGENRTDENGDPVSMGRWKARESTPKWDPVTRTATSGARGVDWDLLRGDQCWFAPPGVSCGDYYAQFTLPDGSVVPWGGDGTGAGTGAVGERGDMHATNSSASWMQYYNDPTADLVYSLYQTDFETFGYERVVFSQ